MKSIIPFFALGVLLFAPGLRADDVGGRQTLLGPGVDPAKLKITSNTERQTWKFVGDALEVTVAPGEKATPTLFIAPVEGAWDLAAHGHIEATISNPATEGSLRMEMRVDNAGDWRQKPWNVEAVRVHAGKTAPLKVIFGHQYGFNPGYKLDPAKITKVGLYFEHPEKETTYLIESIVASGPAGEVPPVKKAAIRHTPPEGHLLGGSATLKPEQVQAHGGLSAELAQDGVAITLPASAAEGSVSITPPDGAWNLSNFTNVRVNYTNTGKVPVKPTVFLVNSNKEERTDSYPTETPIAPGASAEVTLSFAPRETWQGPQGDLSKPEVRRDSVIGGTKFKSDRVARVAFQFEYDEDAEIRVDAVQAVVIERPLPDWVGKRPPVPGDWKLSFSDDFEGDELNLEVWEPMAPNWWGEKAIKRYDRENVIVEDGVVKLRVENRPGWKNNDPATGEKVPYAAGVLRTYGKWTQLYGYFEARMKLPGKTGLWPAFWLMPDRGEQAGEQWKRQDTAKDGMEFDIMEHLSRWGPYRYTTAMHWDGYGKGHKATGAAVYFNPAPDGWITSGLLWLPGQAVYYVNGQEVARWEIDRISTIPSEILFTMPIGGWDNEKRPVDAELPADFEIDYVRVWQRADFTPGGKPQ